MKKSFMEFIKSRTMIYILAAVVLVGVVVGVVLVKNAKSTPADKGKQENSKQEDEDDIGLNPSDDAEDNNGEWDVIDKKPSSETSSDKKPSDKTPSYEKDEKPESSDKDDEKPGEDKDEPGTDEKPLNDGSPGRLF